MRQIYFNYWWNRNIRIISIIDESKYLLIDETELLKNFIDWWDRNNQNIY
jgi:hypothetical protein